MKMLLKRFLGSCTLRRSTLLLGLTTCASTCLPLAALSMPGDLRDSRLVAWKCDSGYNLEVVNKRDGELTYHATGPAGKINLGNGISQDIKDEKGVSVGWMFTFNNGIYSYQMTPDNKEMDISKSGTLEVFKNNRRVLMQSCRAS